MTSKVSVSTRSKLASGKWIQVACIYTVASPSAAHRIQCILHLSLQLQPGWTLAPEQAVLFPRLSRFGKNRLLSVNHTLLIL